MKAENRLKQPDESAGKWLYSVNGMHCVGCIRKIQKAAAEMDLGDAEVDLGRKQVTLRAKPSENPIVFRDRINQLGFEAKIIKSGPDDGESKKTARTFLARIGVTGACAGNIMLISVAGYSGADISDLSEFFSIVSGILFFPVFTFGAFPFYQNCWVNLKRRRVSVDVPIALAVLAGGAISYYHSLTGSNQVYFDSISMFIFFLLSSRFLVFSVQKRYLRPMELSDLSDDRLHTVERSGQTIVCSGIEMHKSDIVYVNQGEVIPADGDLISPFALIDASVFSGESMPSTFKSQCPLFAGMRNVGDRIRFRVSKPASESRIQNIIDRVNRVTLKDSRLLNLTDRGAGLLTTLIILLAGVFGVLAAVYSIPEPIDRILALLVVACPCALAIASPLSISLTIRKALNKGLLIKDANIFDSLPQVEIFIFDKTGTLSSDLEVNEVLLNDTTAEDLNVLHTMESRFDHPVARCIRNYFGSKNELLVSANTDPSGGVRGTYQGDEYLVAPASSDSEKIFELTKNGHTILRFSMTEKVDDSTRRYISKLLEKGKVVCLVTGDTKAQALKMGEALGLKKSNVFYETSPEKKVEILRSLREKTTQPIVFVGDGVNDVLALREADISVSTMSSAEASFNVSQVHLVDRGVGALDWLTSICQKSTRTVQWLVVTSLVYNIGFGFLALAGYISPLVAVIIMPLSTLSLTSFVLYRSRDNLKGATK